MTAMEAAINAAVKAVMAKKTKTKSKKAKGRSTLSEAEKAVYAAKNDAECIAVFTKAGYKDVQPRVNVLTYGKVKPDGSKTGWLSMGRQVKKGQKAVRVGPFALFHITQTEVIGTEPSAPVTAESATANSLPL